MITADNYLKTKGLGVTPLPASVINYQVPIPSQTTPITTSNFWSGLTNIFTKVNTVAQQAAPLVTQVKNTVDVLKNNTANNPAYNFGVNPQPLQTTQPMSTQKKVLIGAGIAAVLGTVYLVSKKRKK